ncbi:MAG: hypothetical protein AAGI49_07000 [Bacteroidota bacterium]
MNFISDILANIFIRAVVIVLFSFVGFQIHKIKRKRELKHKRRIYKSFDERIRKSLQEKLQSNFNEAIIDESPMLYRETKNATILIKIKHGKTKIGVLWRDKNKDKHYELVFDFDRLNKDKAKHKKPSIGVEKAFIFQEYTKIQEKTSTELLTLIDENTKFLTNYISKNFSLISFQEYAELKK